MGGWRRAAEPRWSPTFPGEPEESGLCVWCRVCCTGHYTLHTPGVRPHYHRPAHTLHHNHWLPAPYHTLLNSFCYCCCCCWRLCPQHHRGLLDGRSPPNTSGASLTLGRRRKPTSVGGWVGVGGTGGVVFPAMVLAALRQECGSRPRHPKQYGCRRHQSVVLNRCFSVKWPVRSMAQRVGGGDRVARPWVATVSGAR